MAKKLIIGVSGKKQSGKNTMCDCLYKLFAEKYSSDDVSILSFADALKQKACKDILGLTEEQVNGTDEDKNSLTIYKWENLPGEVIARYATHGSSIEWTEGHNGIVHGQAPVTYREGFMTAREIMQIVGTDIFRNFFDNDIWVNATLRNIEQSSARVILISDVRFPGEVDSIINNGGYVIRLSRDTCQTDPHPSETALDDFDFKHKNCIMFDNKEMDIYQQNAHTKILIDDIFLMAIGKE